MIQMEYCKGQSLDDYLHSRNKGKEVGFWNRRTRKGLIDRRQNHTIFRQIVQGMVEMHKANVIHRDLKPENIFVDRQAKTGAVDAKIGDFGLARMLTEHGAQLSNPAPHHLNGAQSAQFSSIAGTEAYMAPEVLSHYHAGTKPSKLEMEKLKKQDVYQLGLILYELSRRIGSHMERGILFRKLRDQQDISDSTGEDCPLKEGEHIEHEMILRMTAEDPDARPTVQEIRDNLL